MQRQGMCHLLQLPDICMERDDAVESGRGTCIDQGFLRPQVIHYLHLDRHYCVDSVSVSPTLGSSRGNAPSPSTVDHEKRDNHAHNHSSHGFNFTPFDFVVLKFI